MKFSVAEAWMGDHRWSIQFSDGQRIRDLRPWEGSLPIATQYTNRDFFLAARVMATLSTFARTLADVQFDVERLSWPTKESAERAIGLFEMMMPAIEAQVENEFPDRTRWPSWALEAVRNGWDPPPGWKPNA